MANQLLEKFENVKQEALSELNKVIDKETLENIRIKFLGSKGLFTELMKSLGTLGKDERPKVGAIANQIRTLLNEKYNKILVAIEDEENKKEKLDITLPGRRRNFGRIHLITRTMLEICDIFSSLGFSVVEGPEVETDYYNFEALNFPADHPARDMQDSLFVGHNLLLRTHTSPMQVRTMEKEEPPVWVVVPGKTYRRDSDITHSPMFHQVEGLLVDKGITMGDLKGVLTAFLMEIFHTELKLRFRPSFFPFTEPSAEVDISCVLCQGQGCRICKNTGWLEILGCGMIDPALYGFVGYNPQEVSGFAFGMGIERIAMLKYGLDDIRQLYEGDLRFLNQF